MLLNLHVKNLALIDEADVDFKNGLNILTGETGAGKSIIIGSINLALGGKISKEMIRANSEYALAELVFLVENEAQIKALKRMDIEPDDNQLIISRKITNGRSVSKVNGETVTAGALKKIAEILIDVHGQHEHQSLLKRQKHLDILDEFAKAELERPQKEMSELYHDFCQLTKELDEIDMDESMRERELSFLQFEIEEIQAAALSPGEDEELETAYRKMINAKKIAENLNQIYQLTGEGEETDAQTLVGNAVHELSGIVQYDSALEGLQSQLLDIEGLLSDFNREIASYLSALEFSEEDFYKTEERLNCINHLKSKYGSQISDILDAQTEREQKYNTLLHYDETVKEKQQQLQDVSAQLEHTAKKIRSIRKSYAKQLVKEITAALEDMNFQEARFDMKFTEKKQFSASGMDEAEFMISTNPGQALMPLLKVASGGELSRIMLAIKTVLAQKDPIDTMIFDEIDVGISGRTAQKISEKMGLLSTKKQIICITHLPQIASMADAHYLIEKNVKQEKTITTIVELNQKQSIEELARLLGGAEITETVLKNATEMKKLANKIKHP